MVLWLKACHDVAQEQDEVEELEPRDAADVQLITERHNEAEYPIKKKYSYLCSIGKKFGHRINVG